MKAATFDDARHTTGGDRGSVAGSFYVFLQLLRHDAARRSLRWSVPFAVLVGLLIRIAAGGALKGWGQLPIYEQHPMQVPLLVYLWLAVLFAVIIAHFNSRCSSLGLTLPLSPRRLWFSRLVSVAGAGLVPIAIVVAIPTIVDRSAPMGVVLPLLPLGARAGAILVLAVVLFQLPSPSVYRISGNKWYVLYVALVSIAALIYTLMSPGSWVYTAMPLAAAVIVGLAVGYGLPPGFKMSGVETATVQVRDAYDADIAARQFAAAMRKRGRLRRGLGLLWIIWRETLNTWPSWLMVFLITASAWGITHTYFAVYHPLYDSVSLMLWSWVFMCNAVKRLNRIDYLPVSRAVIFTVVVATLVVACGAGVILGYVLYRTDKTPMAAVCYCNRTIRVPFDAWEISWKGEVPEVESGWGESYTPHGMRITTLVPNVVVYNPFEPGDNSSPRFVAMQIDRAVARVHGTDAVSPSMFTCMEDTAFVAAMSDKDKKYLVEASLRRPSDLRSRTNAVIIMFWMLLFAVVNAVWWKRYGPDADIERTRWFAILFFSIPYAAVTGFEVLTAKGVADSDAIMAFQMIVLRSIGQAIPLGTGMLWISTAALALASFAVLSMRFARVEAPVPRAGKHLLSEY